MRIVSFIAVPALATFLLFACQPANSPESVVRQWQSHVDHNEFEKAKVLSAPRTEALLSWMEVLLSEMDADSVVTQTDFKEINCKESGDKAVCYYTMEEEGQTFYDSFLLVRIDGKWLVDLPEEALYEEGEEDMESLFQLMSQDSIDQ
ncbi:MAG: hypothetical protein IPJ40_19080 [Saprospirales bacterium]|nr:hypothetical protein [Saprospirales bacterium]